MTRIRMISSGLALVFTSSTLGCVRVYVRRPDRTATLAPGEAVEHVCHPRNAHVLECQGMGPSVIYLVGVRDASTVREMNSGTICAPRVGGGVTCRGLDRRSAKSYRPLHRTRGRDREQDIIFWRDGFCMKSWDLGDHSFFRCESLGQGETSVSVMLKEDRRVVTFDDGVCICGEPNTGKLLSFIGMPEGFATCIINRFQSHPVRRTPAGDESVTETSLRIVEILPKRQHQGAFRGSTICDDIEREPAHALSTIFETEGSVTPDAGADRVE